jgi:uncharacterized membrane protein YfcA
MNRVKVITSIWLFSLIAASVVLLSLLDSQSTSFDIQEWIVVIFILLLSAFCEYIDSSLGMGYGTTLTPLLLAFGVARHDIVPSILLSEFITGFFACIAHNHEGNVNFKTDKTIKTIAFYLIVPSVIGVVIAIALSNKLESFGKNYANLYIGIMIMLIGLYLIYRNYVKKNTTGSLSKPGLLILGTVAAFNKGVSGGGYGPLMTGGQLSAGVNEKKAIVITSLCECFTCFIGLIAFFLLGGQLNLFYTIPLCLGSLLSVIPAAKTVKILPDGILKNAIGWATLFLGALVLWKFLH